MSEIPKEMEEFLSMYGQLLYGFVGTINDDDDVGSLVLLVRELHDLQKLAYKRMDEIVEKEREEEL
jgi:hypothetical protein